MRKKEKEKYENRSMEKKNWTASLNKRKREKKKIKEKQTIGKNKTN